MRFMSFTKLVAFKDRDGNYLGVDMAGGKSFLRFESDDFQYDRSEIVHEIFSLPRGGISIKSKANGKLWRTHDNGFVLADIDTDYAFSADDPAIRFMPYKVSNHHHSIHLGSVLNNTFGRGISKDGGETTRLRFAYDESKATRLEIEYH